MDENFFYPLYKEFDNAFFSKLKVAVVKGVEFRGDDKEKERFIKDLLVLQLIQDYRKHLKIVYKSMYGSDVNISKINQATDRLNFDFDTSWAVFKVEQELVKMGKNLLKHDLKLEGSNRRFNEFILRYLISVWLVDWIGPLYAILKMIETNKYILNLREVNKLLALWDFTRIFKNANN